jgi:hypothetical protein
MLLSTILVPNVIYKIKNTQEKIYYINNYNVRYVQHTTAHTEKRQWKQSDMDLSSNQPIIQSMPVGTAQRQTYLG